MAKRGQPMVMAFHYWPVMALTYEETLNLKMHSLVNPNKQYNKSKM